MTAVKQPLDDNSCSTKRSWMIAMAKRRARSTKDHVTAVQPSQAEELHFLSTSSLVPHPKNPRKHTPGQIRAIAKSIETFGFNAPILVDKKKQIIVGNGRYEAAKLLGLTEVPVRCLDHLNTNKAQAYQIADNKLTDRSSWDERALAVQLQELTLDPVLEFDIEATGFEAPEIDFLIQSIEECGIADSADDFTPTIGPALSAHGDLWTLGEHRVYCGSALDAAAFERLFESKDGKATAVFTDPPYNVPIGGHVSGKGRKTHREFPMASGEMSEVEFAGFLKSSFSQISDHTAEGSLIYACIDWRHMVEMHSAGRSSDWELVNLCVWAKSNGGMGSLYRSRHEFVFVFKNGKTPHINNVQLGRFGRNRSNVWNYAGANTFGRRKADCDVHPTVKPILMVVDAILDSTNRGDIVLDPFLGSGTTVLAAQRTARRCFGIELDPLYVDTIVERWQRATGLKAHNHLGETFALVQSKRRVAP